MVLSVFKLIIFCLILLILVVVFLKAQFSDFFFVFIVSERYFNVSYSHNKTSSGISPPKKNAQ